MDIKNKKIIIIVSSIIAAIFIISVVIAIIINNYNKQIKDSDHLYIVIERFDESNNKIFYKELLFTKELDYQEKIPSLKIEGGYNIVNIKNGLCTVIEANCPGHNCMFLTINIENDIINNTDIQCKYNGLYVHLENQSVGE